MVKHLMTVAQTIVAGACQEDWRSPAFLMSGVGRLCAPFPASKSLLAREGALLASGPCQRQPAKEHKVPFRSPQGHSDKVVCSVPSRADFDAAKGEDALALACN